MISTEQQRKEGRVSFPKGIFKTISTFEDDISGDEMIFSKKTNNSPHFCLSQYKFFSIYFNFTRDKQTMELSEKLDIQLWQTTFPSLDEVIDYHNSRAIKSNYFYILDKTKYVSFGQLF